MNVLMLAPAECIHSLRPLNWLLERKCRVTFVDYRRPKSAVRNGFAYAPYPTARGMRYCGWLGCWTQERLRRFLVSMQLRYLRWRAGAEVVHVHWVNQRAYDCAAAGLRPLVLTVWGSDVNGLLAPNADERERALVGKALAAADLVIVDSPDMPEKCAALAGRPVPTAMLPLGIDTGHFRPAAPEAVAGWRRRLDIPDGAIVFMSVRAMAPLYGHHHILEAFAKARGGAARRAVLVFKVYNRDNYPDGPSYERRLRDRAEELALADCVRWVAETPYADLPPLYCLADAIVNYPVADGFPVTFLEAAACERPVITAALPAYQGSFAETAFQLVPPDDVDGLAAAMRATMNGAVGGTNFEEVRTLVVREHDESVSAARLLEYYRELLRPGGTWKQDDASRICGRKSSQTVSGASRAN